jgi:hypothetical protein
MGVRRLVHSLSLLVVGLLAAHCSPGLTRAPAPTSATTSGSSPALYAAAARVSSASAPAAAQQLTGTRTYSTSFPAAENPISESGNWINGGTTGLDWTDVRTTTGKVFGTQSGNDSNPFNDSTTLLTGSWGNDQGAQATLYITSTPSSCCVEVELRLRSTMTAHNSTGYEFGCSVASSSPYMGITVWPGPLEPTLNDYPTVAFRGDMGCAAGDVLGATAVGSTLTLFKNGEAVLSGTDTTFADGSPGVGLFLHNQTGIKDFFLHNQTGINENYGFTNFAANDGGALPGANTQTPVTWEQVAAVTGTSPTGDYGRSTTHIEHVRRNGLYVTSLTN